jgi:hypothetical protein
VRPASEKAAFGGRGPALYPKDAGNVNALAAEMSDQRISCRVIAHSGDGQDPRAEGGEIIGGVGAAARNNLSFSMFEDQDRRFARNARDFTILEFVGDEITKENDSFRGELLDALAEGEEINGR